MIIFERRYSVNVFDTDHTGRLGTASLFNYFQDLAGRHASLLGFGREHLMTDGNFWVLSRITVEIDRMPAAWDEVTLRTWPRGTENIFALRDLEMYDAEGKRLSAASSSWVVLDYGTRRIQRPDKALSHLNTTFPDARALTRNAAKIPAVPADNQQITRLTAAPGDIDVNLHVNNARYIEWVTDSYDPQFLSNHTPYAIDVNYLSEGHYGDNIAIIKAEEGGSERSCFHSVIREEDNVELCRIRIKWKEGIL